MKKLIQAAMEKPEDAQSAGGKQSPGPDAAASPRTKSRGSSTGRRSSKITLHLPTADHGRVPVAGRTSRRPSVTSSSVSQDTSESTAAASSSKESTSKARRRRTSRSSASSKRTDSPEGSQLQASETQQGRMPTSINLVRQLRAVVSAIYGKDSESGGVHAANVTAIVNRLQPLLHRAVDDNGQPLTSLCEDVDVGEQGSVGVAFDKLKTLLSAEFADAITAEREIEEKTAQRMKNREKKMWERFGTFLQASTQPLYLQKRSKFVSRYWDFDSPAMVAHNVTDQDWEEMRYCRYLRQGLPKFTKEKPDVTTS